MTAQQRNCEQFATPEAVAFYRQVLRTLQHTDVPFLVGGGYAFYTRTTIARATKDLDLFLIKADVQRALAALGTQGYQTEITASHWLAKAYSGREFIDIIFNSGNGSCPVDDRWFEHATDAQVLGLAVKLCPPEESIWQKAFIMERERFDGADVAYLLRTCGESLDWDRLIERFGAHWRVLLAHLILFGYIFPDRRSTIPAWVMDGLTYRARQEQTAPDQDNPTCFGTLLSRKQYTFATNDLGYHDGRLPPTGSMTADQIALWDAEAE